MEFQWRKLKSMPRLIEHASRNEQDRFGTVLDNPPLAEDICHDPVLRGLKLVAAPGDSNLLPRNGVRGFPHWGVWMQTVSTGLHSPSSDQILWYISWFSVFAEVCQAPSLVAVMLPAQRSALDEHFAPVTSC
eukprot:964171-Pelagomonas_calceolata.AAC.1